MVNGHKNAIDLFQKELEQGNDPKIKAWANKTISVLQTHLQMAEAIQKKMNI